MSTPSNCYDVIILGAGAAGLICAFTAAQRGRRVLVLEKSNKVGKKILMSGGGRCNFANLFVEADNFISANTHFCKAALKRYTQWDFIALVEKHKIEYEQRKHGQLFCIHSAKDILAMLVNECELAGVQINCRSDVGEINLVTGDGEEPGYEVDTGVAAKTSCTSLVVATGGLSIPTLGGSGLGYEIAEQFGLPMTERRAGLVPFMFSDSFKLLSERLSGLATEVEVRCNGQSFTENLLFTHRGLSGPAILQISNYWHPGDEIGINLLPGLNTGEWLLEQKSTQGKNKLKNQLAQKLPRALIAELQTLLWPAQAEARLADISDTKLAAIAGQLENWRLKPSATEGYRTAEVTLGGVDTNSLSSKTLEVKHQPGLYFIGEVLDVTGQLGGFNFQWAWSSGYSAGLVA